MQLARVAVTNHDWELETASWRLANWHWNAGSLELCAGGWKLGTRVLEMVIGDGVVCLWLVSRVNAFQCAGAPRARGQTRRH